MFEHFFLTGELPGNIVEGKYSPLLVIASYLIASFGAFTGLTLAGRLTASHNRRSKRMLHGMGAIAFGSSIWSMHFLGMLAYDTDMVHTYNPWLTIFSGIIAVTAGWCVFWIARVRRLSSTRLSIGATLLGLGIAAMHYIGMAAMEMDASLRYIPSLFVVSVVISIAASGASLWIFFVLGQRSLSRQILWRIIAGLTMGLAVCGMHYTGMEAAVIIPSINCQFNPGQSFSLLEISVLTATGLICMLSLMVGVANRGMLMIAGAIIFSLPLVAIVYQAISALNADIRFTEKEQQGLAYHEELIDLLIGLQASQGLTNIEQRGGAMEEGLVASQKKEVRNWVAKVDRVDGLYGKRLSITEDWLAIKPQFGHFLEQHPQHGYASAEAEFAEHSKIIQSLMSFMESVVDKSNLSTDPQSDSNLAANILYSLMPELIETLGKIRGTGAGYLVSHQHMPSQEVKTLRTLYDQLRMLDALMENRLLRSAKAVPEAQRFMDYYAETIKPQLNDFMLRYERIFSTRKTSWTPQTLFSDVTAIIQSYDVLYNNMADRFSDVLEHRQAEYRMKKNVVLSSSLVGLLGFIALFIFLFRSLTKMERTEQKALEYIEQVQEAQMQALEAKMAAEKAAAAKSDFLANMSHELRTPMNGVLGMASLLADTELNEEQQKYVTIINGSGESLLMLLNDILDFSKIEAGALTLEHIAYDVRENVAIVTTLLRPQADKKFIDLRLECDPNTPEYAWGDPGRVRQILINLLGNAIKFTERGYVELVMRLQEDGKGGSLHVSVADTGIGIPVDKVGTIFDKFTQADTSVTRKFGGTGLGLAITKQLVELMGGRIGVESAEGKGSTFWFTIPCQRASKEDAGLVGVHKNTGTVSHGKRLAIGEAKILLVEDYPVNQVFAEKLLRKFGIRHIDLAENGAEALLKYRSKAYDIIFMDCQMPELDGYQTTQKIRLLEEGTPLHTPIVAMTANAMMGDREKCLKAGMDDYLSKPLRTAHLKASLETWFDLGNDVSLEAPKTALTNEQSDDAPVNMEQLHIFTDGDPQEEKELLTLFLTQAKTMIDVLEKNIRSDSAEAWKSAAHCFKGSSANLGATKLQHLCKDAESGFQESEARKQEMLAEIKAETARVEAFFGYHAATS